MVGILKTAIKEKFTNFTFSAILIRNREFDKLFDAFPHLMR